MTLGAWLKSLFRSAGGGDHEASPEASVQIQVYHPGEGWQNAGVSPPDPATLRKRSRAALARHGGEKARAIDGDGGIIEIN